MFCVLARLFIAGARYCDAWHVADQPPPGPQDHEALELCPVPVAVIHIGLYIFSAPVVMQTGENPQAHPSRMCNGVHKDKK